MKTKTIKIFIGDSILYREIPDIESSPTPCPMRCDEVTTNDIVNNLTLEEIQNEPPPVVITVDPETPPKRRRGRPRAVKAEE